MAFDSSVVTNLAIRRDETDMLVAWSTTAPVGTYFQVYQDHRLVWVGSALRVHLPYPDGIVNIDVGAVDDDEIRDDLSASLPAIVGSGAVVELTWLGGSYLDSTGLDDVQGFHVYSGTVAGGAVSYTTPVATIPAYAGGVILDGFGLGGYGGGGFGRSESSYSWRSDRLGVGTWNFAIKSYDAAGNEGTAATVSKAITGPPRPPEPTDDGARLTRSYVSGTRVVTLSWLASPT